MREHELTRFFSTKQAFLLALLAATAGTVLAYFTGTVEPITGNTGFAIPSANLWIQNPLLSLAAGVALNAAIAVMLIYINKRFNLLRSISMLFATSFLIIQGAMPMLTGQLYGGSVLCLIILTAINPLYLTFQKPSRTRLIFLTFFLLSLSTVLSIAYVAYIIVFLVGCFQMQNLTLRGTLAIAIGIITPYWILLGLGIVHPGEMQLWSFVNIFDALSGQDVAKIVVYVGITFFIGIICGSINLFRIYGYNARTRAYNGFWIVLAVMTVLMIIVDYSHLIMYIPVLNCCTAVQIGHFFIINNRKRAYIPIVCIIAAYILIYLWDIAT